MSSLIDTNSPSGIDWKPHFAFIVPGMMRKSTLVLPVDSQNQERPIESADPSSFPSISLNACQNPHIIMMWWKKARMISCHETCRKNVKFCWKSAILSEFDQYRSFAHITWPFHNKSSPISTLVWNFNHALVGSLSGVQTQTSKFLLLSLYIIKKREQPFVSYDMMKNCNRSLKISKMA